MDETKDHELAAGPVLDRLIAARVMGWDVEYRLPPGERPAHEGEAHFYDKLTKTLYLPSQWCPSSDPEQALQVLQHLQSEDRHVAACIRVERGAPPDDEPIWSVTIEDGGSRIGTSLEYGFALALSKAMLSLGRPFKS